MTDLDTAAAQPNTEIITQPATLGGVALTRDNIGARAREISLPAVTGRESSWSLLPHAATLAGMVANTDFVPRAVRNNPAAVAALFLLGHELGLGPMSSLQGLTITPTTTGNNGKQYGGDIITYAKTLRAITRSHGHKLWPHPDEYSSERVRWSGYRSDDPTHIMSVVWTMDDAKRAKLLAHDPSKPGAWEKSPRAMLSARSSAELCRLLDEDGLLGISHVVEEMDDDQVVDLPEHDVADGAVDEPPPTAPEGPKTRARSTRPRTTQTKDGTVQPDAPKVELEVPGDNPETQAIAQAPAAGTTPALSSGNPSPVAELEVPGDDSPPLAPVSASAPPDVEQELLSPAIPDVQRAVGEQQLVEGMPADQKIAMLCREASIDKAELVRIMTDKRSESAKDLSPSMQNYVIESLRSVMRGEMRYSPRTIPPFVDVTEHELAEIARVELSRLAGGDKLRPTLATLGWDEERDGKVSAWLATLDRPRLLETISAARAAAPPITEETT